MNKIDKKRIYKRMLVLCWSILLFWFFVKLLGGQGIEIVANSQRFIDFMDFVDSSIIAKWTIGSVSSITLTFLLWLSMLGQKWFYSNRQALVLGVYLSLSTLLKVVFPLSGIVLDFITFILIPVFYIKIKLKVVLLFDLLYVLFQAITMFNRELSFYRLISNSPLIGVIFVFDILILIFMLYCYRKEGFVWDGLEVFGLAKAKNNLKLCVTSVWQNVLKSIRKLLKSMKNLPNLIRSKIDRELFVRKCLSYIAIFTSIGIFAYFTNSLANSFILFICYISLRYLFPTTFHTTPLRCMILSVTLFCIVLGNVLPLETSLLSGVFCAFAFDWCLWRWQEHQDLLCRYDTDFTKYGLSIEMSNFAYDWKVTGLRDKELMIKYEINSVNTLNSRKRRIKQAMHTK